MKEVKYFLFALVITLVSCNKVINTNSACNVENPLENISWLKDIKEIFDKDMGAQRERITQYVYHGNDVFLIEFCYPCPDDLKIVYDCEKNIVCEFGGIEGKNTCPDFIEDASNEIVLYDR